MIITNHMIRRIKKSYSLTNVYKNKCYSSRIAISLHIITAENINKKSQQGSRKLI